MVILVLVPLTLLVGFLIIHRVPGNVVGPLLIVWSGTVAYWSIREEIAPGLFALFFYYDMAFGWFGLFLMLLHFPDGQVYPPGAARWIYPLLAINVFTISLNFLSQAVLTPPGIANPFHLPVLLPYAELILGLCLLFASTILVSILIFQVLRYRKASYRERQQIKWLALFAGTLSLFSLLSFIAYPLLTGGEVMYPGNNLFALLF